MQVGAGDTESTSNSKQAALPLGQFGRPVTVHTGCILSHVRTTPTRRVKQLGCALGLSQSGALRAPSSTEVSVTCTSTY